MEWMVVCRRDLTAAKRVLEVIDMTYITFGPKGNDLPDFFEPLLFVLLWPVERFRVGDLDKVLVQVFGEDVHVLGVESSAPLFYELDLRGPGGHCDQEAKALGPDHVPELRFINPQARSRPWVLTRNRSLVIK